MLRTIVKFFIIFAVFSIIAGLSAFFALSFFIQSEKPVVVPDLKDKNAVAALQLLSGLELNTRVRGFEYDEHVPENHVISQAPEPGRTIKKGRDISLVISKGAAMVVLPDLAGQNLARARIIVEKNGLLAKNTTRVYSDHAKRDTVIAQFPSAGEKVKRSSSVDILSSLGPRPATFKMPELQGRHLDEAMMLIDQYKLFLDAINTVYDKSKPENMVIRHNPPAGHYVEESRKVNLTVNRKPAEDETGRTASNRLFTYTIPHGYLKQHIRLELSIYGMNVLVYDKLMEPGKEIWAVVPEHTRAAVFLYRNDELIATEVYY